MIAQYRPDIARIAEETVLNLKGLENTLEAIRNDLAWLCNQIGHPEAARIALTPTRGAASFAPLTAMGAAGSLVPGVSMPFAPHAQGVPPFIAPSGIGVPFVGSNPYGVPYVGSNAYGVPFVGSNPYGVPGLLGVPPWTVPSIVGAPGFYPGATNASPTGLTTLFR